jgi:hypothetical protein
VLFVIVVVNLLVRCEVFELFVTVMIFSLEFVLNVLSQFL